MRLETTLKKAVLSNQASTQVNAELKIESNRVIGGTVNITVTDDVTVEAKDMKSIIITVNIAELKKVAEML